MNNVMNRLGLHLGRPVCDQASYDYMMKSQHLTPEDLKLWVVLPNFRSADEYLNGYGSKKPRKPRIKKTMNKL